MPTSDRPHFLFVTCQVGFEWAVKSELSRLWPQFRFAYSRPGFLTFKLPADHCVVANFELGSVFARAYGFCLGKVTGGSLDALAQAAWDVYGGRPFRRMHVWERDTAAPGERGFEPTITPVAIEAHVALVRHCPHPEMLAEGGRDPWSQARRGEFVLDCVIVGAGEWWIGYHRTQSVPSQWPGGLMRLEIPSDAVSRAWLKMEEALRWSRLPIPAGARCADIGSAPGGASQALLSRGLLVTGIDPAEMHPTVMGHPGFTHIRRRAAQVRRRQFRKIRWLIADMNVTPTYTCDVVEGIVTHREVHVRGVLLTLKLFDRSHVDRVPEYLERVRDWGYNFAQARQLQYNRQEACIAGLQKPFFRNYLRPEA
ncbi:MAG: SAM-dependent methyltransferase [Planctomycetota bacterium]|jgi:23S rRNA (cytidine2498-2'-O)-methyltransferase